MRITRKLFWFSVCLFVFRFCFMEDSFYGWSSVCTYCLPLLIATTSPTVVASLRFNKPFLFPPIDISNSSLFSPGHLRSTIWSRAATEKKSFSRGQLTPKPKCHENLVSLFSSSEHTDLYWNAPAVADVGGWP